MSEWKESVLDEIAIINPTETVSKGVNAKKIAMEMLKPFSKKVNGYSIEPYNGGMKFRNGDTVVARITPCLENGKTAYIDILDKNEIGFGSTEYIVIREKANITDKQFLYYFAISDEFRDVAILAMTGSSGRQRVEIDVVRNHTFFLPPLPEQRAIASVLSSLDDKIDLLHRQNKTLEAMAETLFRQWFVPFASALGTKKGEGWEQGKISDLIDFNPTRLLPKGTIAPYLEMSNVSTSVFHPENWYDREFSSGMKFINGDTLIARITPCLENGKSAYITFLKDGQVGWGSTEFIVMRSKEMLHPLFTYALAKNKDFRDYAEGCLEGSSGRQRVNIDHLVDFEITIPPKRIIDTFNSTMAGFEPKLHNNFLEIRTLEKLRNTLLPKLMAGEVWVAF